ncbi:hypothetical protein DyAD56_03165 [Dyella sp. AD56]|nr:hypothetical protein DyAD56_03165 [Dyella sp. AD56]ULU25024.1 hypothetical protein DYST_01947 [Dyella terrae]
MLVADYDSKVMRIGRKIALVAFGRVSNSQMQIRCHTAQEHLD